MPTELPLSAGDRAFLRTLPMFAALAPRSFEEITATAQHLDARPKTPLAREGEPAREIYAIQSGWVKLSRHSPQGEEAIISLLTRGGTIGEAVSLLSRPYPTDAETVTQCSIIRINATELMRLLKQNPGLAAGMMASMSRQLHQLVGEITRLKALNGAARLLDFLADAAAGQPGLAFTLPFEKQLLARHLSMQPESLSRTLRRLRGFGITVDGRTVTLASRDALTRAAVELSR